jgi:hypothetical protein
VIHRFRAVNTAIQAENKIHDDRVAARYGFRGGLVPGVTVFGYMMEPILGIAPEWLERGTAELRLLEPFFDGDEVVVRAASTEPGAFQVTAEGEDGATCARAAVQIDVAGDDPPHLIDRTPLPAPDQRPAPSPTTLVAGKLLGSLSAGIDSPVPEKILQLSNDILERNFRLPPWIHVASELRNWSAVQAGEQVSVRGRVQDRFDKKGHEFAVIDVMIVGGDDRLIQTVRHTAIYRLREPGPQAIP